MQQQINFLIRFFNREEYLQEFIDGNIYMSSLSSFINIKLDESRKINLGERGLAHPILNPERRDPWEGIIAGYNKKEFEKNFNEGVLNAFASEIRVRALGYQYFNVCCFYSLPVQMITKGVGEYYDPQMNDFGQYVAIVLNPKELIERVMSKTDSEGYQFLAGPIEYSAPTRFFPSVAEGWIGRFEMESALSFSSLPDACKAIQYDAFMLTSQNY